jgi:hypothetical protein
VTVWIRREAESYVGKAAGDEANRGGVYIYYFSLTISLLATTRLEALLTFSSGTRPWKKQNRFGAGDGAEKTVLFPARLQQDYSSL